MNEAIYRDSIIGYLNRQSPQGPLEVTKASGDIKAVALALIDFIERLNAPREVKLLQTEMARLKIEVNNLEQSIEQASLYNDEYQVLSQRREILAAEQATISDLSRQKAEIEQLQAFVAKHNIPALQHELQQLQKGMEGDIGNLNAWFNEAETFFIQLNSDFTRETKNLSLELAHRRKQIDEVLNDARAGMQSEQTHISKLLQDYDKDFSEVHSKYILLAEQLNAIKAKLVEIRHNHDNNVSAYEMHFAQNKNIYGELGKRHNLDAYLKDHFERIEKNLRQFDQEIKVLVEKADHMTIF